MRKLGQKKADWLRLAKTHLDEHSPLRFILLPENDSVTFLPLQGDFARFNLAEGETLSLADLRSRIETDHLFVDVMGEPAYLAYLADKVFGIEDTEVFLVPWKEAGDPLWLLVRLKKAQTPSEKDIVVGEIVHIHDDEPHTLALFRLAHRDDPTGLWNRKALRERLPRLDADKTHHALYIDLDDFKDINDTYGHNTGDKVLQEVARRLRDERTEKREFYRVGGDEFLALLLEADTEEARCFAKRLTTRFTDIAVAGERIDMTASIGVVRISAADRDFVRIVEKADKAMYTAKAAGKAGVAVAP